MECKSPLLSPPPRCRVSCRAEIRSFRPTSAAATGWVPCGLVSHMRIWVTEAAYAVAFFLTLTFLFISWFVSRQYSRFGRFAGWPALVSAAVVLYGSALIAFTLFPIPNFDDGFCERRSALTEWQLTPLASLDDVPAIYQSEGLLATLTSADFLQVAMNVVFFMPLGFFIAYRLRRSVFVALASSLGISLLIETTQGTGIWGLAPCPYRLSDIDDVITNTSGGVIGWFIGLTLRRVLPDPTPHRESDPGPPGPLRQMIGVLLDVQIYVVVQIAVFALAIAITNFVGNVTGNTLFAITTTAVTFALFVLIPIIRRDRSSPGLASVHLAVVRKNDLSRAPLWSIVVRWMVRWLPITFFGLPALLVILPIEAIVSWRTRGHRSVASIVSRTTLVTRERAAQVAAQESSAESPAPTTTAWRESE